MEYCSTCTGSLASSPPYSQDAASFPQDRRVECCSRVICAKCMQVSHNLMPLICHCMAQQHTPSPLPQGLRDPPLYTSVPGLGSRSIPASAPPPPYKYTDDAPAKGSKSTPELDEKAAQDDTLHFLDHDHDTVQSLSLRYGVPPAALRQRNNLTSDHLLVGRKTILIPGEFYKGGVSLSPRPVEGEEEERRKGKIRRFMTACKVADYDYAVLYMEQAGYDIDAAITAYMDDEAWERSHPNQRRNAEASKVKSRGLFWRGL
ncbi:uncharacterized protein TRIVIDRAFT_120125 [Trichoderma virens Gv29-8]